NAGLRFERNRRNFRACPRSQRVGPAAVARFDTEENRFLAEADAEFAQQFLKGVATGWTQRVELHCVHPPLAYGAKAGEHRLACLHEVLDRGDLGFVEAIQTRLDD